MPKIETILKSEIIRLAKREINAAFRPLAGEVRSMKKKLSDLKGKFAPLEKWTREKMREAEEKKAQLKAPVDEVKKARFSPARIKNLREKLGLSQREMGILTGATIGAVASWEKGKFAPRKDKKAAMLALKKLGKRGVKKVLEKKEAEAGELKPEKGKAKKATKKKTGRRKPGRPAKKKVLKKGARKTAKKKAGRPKKAGTRKKRAGRAKR